MGTFSRLRYVIAANVNALLEKELVMQVHDSADRRRHWLRALGGQIAR